MWTCAWNRRSSGMNDQAKLMDIEAGLILYLKKIKNCQARWHISSNEITKSEGADPIVGIEKIDNRRF